MQFRPLHDRVLVKRIDSDEKSKGGIIIPDTAKEKPMEGEIVSAGPGARDETGKVQPLDVKAGDKIPGQAVVVEMDSTALIHAGCQAVIDQFGNIIINPVDA